MSRLKELSVSIDKKLDAPGAPGAGVGIIAHPDKGTGGTSGWRSGSSNSASSRELAAQVKTEVQAKPEEKKQEVLAKLLAFKDQLRKKRRTVQNKADAWESKEKGSEQRKGVGNLFQLLASCYPVAYPNFLATPLREEAA